MTDEQTAVQAPQNAPTREELLKAVDFEIERFAKEYQRPGWTEWAIYGGLAVVFGGIISIPYTANLSITGSIQILVALFLAYECLGVFGLMYTPRKGPNDGWLTFHRHAYISSPRSQFASIAVRAGFVLATMLCAEGVGWSGWILSLLWSLVSLVAYSGAFWLWFEDYPIKRFRAEEPNSWKVFLIGLSGSIVITIPFYWAALDYLVAGIGKAVEGELANQFKLAGLGFALIFLFQKLFHEPAPQQILDELVEIRRAFLFYEIDSSSVISRLKKVLGRQNAKEFMEGLYADYQDAMKKYIWVLDKAIEWNRVRYSPVPEGEGVHSYSPEVMDWNNLKNFGSDDSVQYCRGQVQRLSKRFDRELRRTKQNLPFDLYEITEVEKEIAELKGTIELKNDTLEMERRRTD